MPVLRAPQCSKSGPSSQAIAELERPLEELRAANAKVHIHGVLIDLHHLYGASGDPRAEGCRREAAAIRAEVDGR
jgi:hypothetical protein